MSNIFLLGLLLCWILPAPALRAAVEEPGTSYVRGLTWLGHSSFRLERDGKVIYFDPWKLSGQPHDADIIFITHPHFDHLEPEDVRKIANAKTVIVTVEGCVSQLKRAKVPGKIQVVKPGEVLSIKGIPIEVVAAYNLNKTFHLKQNGWVGFVIQVEDVRVYYAGDTDLIPEMKGITADLTILPVSGTYVMNAAQAVKAARVVNAKVVVPMHYGSVVGSLADAKRAQTEGKDLIVEILEKEGN